MSDTPSPYPVNPYEPSTVTATDASGFAVAGSTVPPGAIEALRQTRPWVLLISIFGIIVSVMMLLGGLAMMFGGATIASAIQKSQGAAGGTGAMDAGNLLALAFAYLLVAVLYLYPLIKLFKYSSAIKALSSSGSALDLERALMQQKSFWKFFGVIAAIVLVIYLIIFIIGAVAAFSGMADKG